MNEEKLGTFYAALAYFFWGLLPIYWKLVDQVPAGEILAHRIIWSFVFMMIMVVLSGKIRALQSQFKALFADGKQAWGLAAAAVVISLNWLTYIWAVNSGHVIQASLGYYINPLVSIILGVVILREAVSRRLIVSFVLAAIGVIYLTFSYGVFPWVSIILALTFAAYGLLKKTVSISSMFGLTIETFFVTPVALLYLWVIPHNAFTAETALTSQGLLLMGAGAATAVPLLLFASGARRIPLSMVGFLQYIAPTIMLLLGVFAYDEAFTSAHLIAFVFIWIALVIYMGEAFRTGNRKKQAS